MTPNTSCSGIGGLAAGQLSRRTLLTSTASAMALAPAAATAANGGPALEVPRAADPQPAFSFDLVVNGYTRQLAIDPRTTLLDALRDHLALTGAKKGCDHGQCGACTVLVGGRRVLGCLTLAAAVRAPVTTIEGLGGPNGRLHPLQTAFIERDAFQCGYCTPGQIMSGVGCIAEGHAGSDAEIREYMSGNLCRCGAYPHIVGAIADARDTARS